MVRRKKACVRSDTAVEGGSPGVARIASDAASASAPTRWSSPVHSSASIAFLSGKWS